MIWQCSLEAECNALHCLRFLQGLQCVSFSLFFHVVQANLDPMPTQTRYGRIE